MLQESADHMPDTRAGELRTPTEVPGTVPIPPRQIIVRHTIVGAAFLLLYLFLNHPAVILLARIGFVAWYPAAGLVMALLLGVSPWYAGLVCVATPIAGKLIYGVPVLSFSYTLDAVAVGVCYGTAAYILRRPLTIDVKLRQRRDVVLYIFVTSIAAVIAAITGAACLVADHSIPRHELVSSTIAWFLGDGIGLLGIAPFLLVHVCPRIRKWLSMADSRPGQEDSTRDKRPFRPGAVAELLAQIWVMGALLYVMFGSTWGRYEHFYLSFIPIIWIAMRQGIRRVVTAMLAFNFGMVVAMHLFPPTSAMFIKVALLMLVLSSVAFVVGSEVTERQRIAVQLKERGAYLDELVKELELRNRQMTLLNQMANELECSGTVKEACAVVARSAEQLFPEAVSGTLYLFSASRKMVEAGVRWGQAGISEPMFKLDDCCSLRRAQPHWSEPGAGCAHLQASEAIKALCVPLITKGTTIGVLYLQFDSATATQNNGKPGSQQLDQQRLALSVGPQVALSLASLRLREALHEQSIRDPLTGLYNRRFLQEWLEKELQRANRGGECMSVLLLDLDHFKRFNDTFGHDAGDHVLRSIAGVFLQFFRSSDLCCRYGGEEFAIILPGASPEDAIVRAERLRQQVRS